MADLLPRNRVVQKTTSQRGDTSQTFSSMRSPSSALVAPFNRLIYPQILTRCSCAEKVCAVETSNERQDNTVLDINLRITQAFSNIGKGYSAIEKFCMASEVHSEVRKAYEAPTDVPVFDISVSFDGSWLTRGHTSLIGIACVIDILTGYVVDFEVMCKVCRNCSVTKRELGESSAEYDIWFEGHRKDCDINHSGSSTSMEMEAALILRERSQEMTFRYSTLLSDGDCKTFNYLTEKNVYGDKFEIKKEECINHVSKRLGTGLRNAVKESRARGISLGGKGHVTLKEATIKKLTLYYQKAIVQNKGNVPAMKKAIYATLHHSISTDQKPQQSKCPIGADSWCFYQSAKAKGQKPGLHKQHVGTPINKSFLPHILSIYQRLVSNELLKRCINCGTQNANESLHNMI
ncbi:uncharacterized protein TNCV_83891 [Trichonephila clavipes]|nr:uncharacterized protein TNCV_83891 [Trichonephila clavipes]